MKKIFLILMLLSLSANIFAANITQVIITDKTTGVKVKGSTEVIPARWIVSMVLDQTNKDCLGLKATDAKRILNKGDNVFDIPTGKNVTSIKKVFVRNYKDEITGPSKSKLALSYPTDSKSVVKGSFSNKKPLQKVFTYSLIKVAGTNNKFVITEK